MIKGLVGGHALDCSDTSSTSGSYPPSGGGGFRVSAQWSYWPKEGDDDELAFPRGAEIQECENIDANWSWGVYCGRMGLFPRSFCKVVDEVNDSIDECDDPIGRDTVVASNRL